MGFLHRSRQLRFMEFIGLSLAVSLQPIAFLPPSALAVVSPAAGTKVGTTASSSAGAFQKVAADAATGITEYKLKSNGLSVLLAERHASPVVTVMVVYKVGSRNEAVGYTGSTHFLEHMMFKGTAKHDPLKGTGIDDVLKPTGAINNATTYYDRTLYYEVAPSTALSTCLELEADRMQGALLRDSDRKSEMTVVRNELERNENYASTILDTLVFATAYREHPYHHPVIGWRSDVEGVPIERLRQFYKEFYYPDNATLVVIGDFKTQEALNTISQYFGKVPKSPKPVPKVYTVEPPQEGERRFVVQRGDELPKVMIGFHIPKATDKDTWPLEVLASVLGDQSRQSSRLYKSLIDSGLASQVSAYNYSMRDPGLFTLFGSATPKTELPVIEKALKAEITKLAKEPVSDTELERAKKAVWKKLKLDAADPSGLATQIAEAIAVADWQWWLSIEQKVKAVTKDDLQRVAAKYFSDKNSTTGYYLPREKNEETKKEPPSTDAPKPASLLAPMMEEYSAFSPLPVKPETAKSEKIATGATQAASAGQATIASKVKKKILANGLTVLVYPIPGSGIAAVAGKIKGGQSYKPVDKTLVPEFVSEMLTKGSKGLSKEALADQIENFGTHFSPDIENFFAEFKSTVVSEDLGQYLKMVSTVLQDPDFSEAELEKAKKIKESELQDALSETSELAANNLLHNLYKPESVYYQKSFPQQTDELKTITVDDLRNFHDKYYSPNNTVLAIVGDVNPDKAFQLAESAFSDWRKKPASPSIAEKPIQWSAPKEKMFSVPVPDKSSVDIVMGRPVPISITSPDFHASQVANAVLGHDTIASRLAVIREKHGLTYGVSSSFMDNAEKNSPWIVQLTVNPENTDKAMTLVKQIITDYRKTGVTKPELQTEVKRLAGEYVVYRMRTPEQIADALTKYELLGLGPEFMDKHPQKLLQVTKDQVDEFVSKYMNINDMVTSVAGSIKKAGPGKAETK